MTEVHRLPITPAPANRLWPTTIARGLMASIAELRERRQLAVLYGQSGIGKTTAARAAVRLAREEGAEACYVRLTHAAEGLQPGLQRIAREVGADVERHMGASDVHDAIVRVLRHRDGIGPALIVVDEAQYASHPLLAGIRDVWDDLHARGAHPAIVLIGTPELHKRLSAPSSAAFRGRCGMIEDLKQLTEDDHATICQHFGVAGPQAARVVAEAGRYGLHRVARLFEHARAEAGGRPIGLAELKSAAKAMGVAR